MGVPEPRPNTKEIGGCFCPLTRGERSLFASSDYLDAVVRHFPRWMLHTIVEQVPVVLRNPDRVWSGVRDPDPGSDRWGYCYSKHFPHKLNNSGRTVPNGTNQVLSVYVNAEFMIYEVRWDESEEADSSWIPKGAAVRFGERVK